MTIAFASISAIRFDEWRSLWLDYTHPHFTDPQLPLHRTTYDRLCAGQDLQGIVAGPAPALGFAHYYFVRPEQPTRS